MSILYMDNFSFYGTDENNMLAGMPWAALFSLNSLENDPDGVSSGKVLEIQNSGTGASAARLAVPTPGNLIGAAFRLWLSSLPQSSNHGATFAWKDASNNHKYALRVTPTGQLVLCRTDGAGTGIDSGDAAAATTLATSSPLVVGAGAWVHIEAYIDKTSGAYEVRVEGVQVLSGTDGAPATGDCGIIEWLQEFDSTASGSPDCYIKDLVVWDDAGSVNNTFIGPVTVYSLVVDGDVSSGWAPSSGTDDYALLDELTPDDAGYIDADDSPPAPSIMTFEDLPADVVSVRALQMVARVQKTDGGDATVQLGLTSNGSTDTGADAAVGTSFAYQFDVSEIDPDTSSLWSPLGVNAAYLQIDRTL